jgi:serine/threonine-protein kinase
MSLSPGSRFGAYEVAAMIGVGGMGEVYRATDPSLKRSVALKVLSESFVSDANRVARLQREAELLASLNHPNVAQIYGLERSGGTTALVMELIEGPTLAERIGQGKLPPSEALGIAQQIAAALEAAHEQGIVHRDLKPANVKLKPDGTVRVLDFGIAKPLEQRALSGPQAPPLTTPAMTEAGMVLGTAAYMSPEQARGKAVDRRADIWAFGCVLYEMLTGKAAFAGDDVTSTLARVLEREPDLAALPRDVAPGVRHTLELCLQKDPKKRLRDIGDVRLALEGALAAPAASRSDILPLGRLALAIAGSIAFGAVFAGAYFLGTRSERTSTPPQPTLSVSRFSITPPADAPLVDGGGVDIAISPDGKRLAYLGRNPKTGVRAIFVRDVDELEAQILPGTDGVAPNANPFFSPDGEWIAFRPVAGGIWRVGLDGVPPVKVLDDPPVGPYAGGHWAADGSMILATGRRLERVSARGDNRAEPLMPEVAQGFVAMPTLLPGGRAVLFALIDESGERAAVLDLETGEHKVLIEGSHPQYAPTGHITFVRGTTLMAVAFDSSELAVTGAPVSFHGVRHPTVQTAPDYAVSPAGTLAYVPPDDRVGGLLRREVVWVDRSGRVIERALAEPVEMARDPRLSPDGSRLLLTTGVFNDGDLWLYDLRGRPPIPLSVVGDNRLGSWSPDGERVAFFREIDIYVVPADGSASTPQPLRSERLTGFVAAWSRDDEMVLNRYSPGLDILTAAATGEIRDVVVTDAAETEAALSPDGRWLAYVSDRTGANEIWAMPYPGGVAVRVSATGGSEPVWSADGRELFYHDDGVMMAVAVDATGEFPFGTPTELFRGLLRLEARVARSYDVARDGRFLMLRDESGAAPVEPASIVVVENWFEELKQRFALAR